jgi:acylphosphatase
VARRCVRATISGRVQGVGYRAWTERTARALGLTGWARNRRNGDVEAVFAGPDDQIAAMLAACRQGPPMALVTDIRILEADDADATETDFRILPTA